MTGTGPQRESPTVRRRAVVIVNPVTIDVSYLRTVVEAEESRGAWQRSVWFETTADEPGQSAARTALQQDPSLIIVVGGDGTIRAVAEGMHTSQTPLAIVPTGTGNLLARNLGLMATVDCAVHTAFTGSSRAIDAGFIALEHEDHSTTNHVFLVMTGVGLDASMAAHTNSALKKRIGWLAYTDPIGRSVLRNEQFSLHYQVDDGHERSIHAHTIIIGNCGTLAAGILLLPDAKPDDGFLDIVMMRPKGFWQWTRVGLRLAIGGILHRWKGGQAILQAAPALRALQYFQARTLTARFDQPQRIQLDGDDFGMILTATITVEHASLTIHVPTRRPPPAKQNLVTYQPPSRHRA